MSNLIKKIVFPIFLCIAVFVAAIIILNNLQINQKNNAYTLKTYKNTVALYNGEDVVKVYSDIVLNTLPEKDVITFNSGIKVSNQQEAETIIQDYDS